MRCEHRAGRLQDPGRGDDALNLGIVLPPSYGGRTRCSRGSGALGCSSLRETLSETKPSSCASEPLRRPSGPVFPESSPPRRRVSGAFLALLGRPVGRCCQSIGLKGMGGTQLSGTEAVTAPSPWMSVLAVFSFKTFHRLSGKVADPSSTLCTDGRKAPTAGNQTKARWTGERRQRSTEIDYAWTEIVSCRKNW